MKNSNIDYNQIINNAFKDGALLCVGNNPVNLMTLSWGFIGVMWGEKVFITAVRDSRYTKKLLSEFDEFAVCVPKEGTMKKELSFCGTKSGRDYNKSEYLNMKMIAAKNINTSIVADSEIVLECKLITSLPCELNILPQEVKDKWYKDGDKHTFYFGKILNL